MTYSRRKDGLGSIGRAEPLARLVLAALALSAATAQAQGIGAPSVHFGALAIPDPDEVAEFGLSLDRFTVGVKGSDSLSLGRAPLACRSASALPLSRRCSYEVQRTFGLNLLYYAYPFKWRRTATIWRLLLHGGSIGNQPTESLQNRFLHRRKGLDFVPSDSVVKGRVQGGLGFDANRWTDVRAGRSDRTSVVAAAFLGIGGGISTHSHEGFLQVGVRSLRWTIGGVAVPSISVMHRSSFVTPSRWERVEIKGEGRAWLYADSTLAETSTLRQASVRVPVDQWLGGSSLVPELELVASTDDFFRRRALTPADDAARRVGMQLRSREKTCALALRWADGDYSVETWNDSCGGKDQGPTYGARLLVRWRPHEGRPR